MVAEPGLPFRDQSSAELQAALVNALRLGGWRHREDLARTLGVSVRAVRDAASHSRGEILSGQRGLILTVCATPEEIDEAIGRMVSQIHEMTRRVVETRLAWERRVFDRQSA